MKKLEISTRVILVIIIILAIVAVILQIANERTNSLETAYEIITFGVAFVAVILAVLQGLANAKTTRELQNITRDIRESLAKMREIESDNDEIRREMREIDADAEITRKLIARDEKLDSESLKILKK